MPRYFFDLYNDMIAIDGEGTELPDLDAAKVHGMREVREMLQASITESGKINLCHRIDIRDEEGQVVHSIRFKDGVTVERGDEVISKPASG